MLTSALVRALELLGPWIVALIGGLALGGILDDWTYFGIPL